MGAWGYRPFENDSACDWIYDFEQKIEKTLWRYVKMKGYPLTHRGARVYGRMVGRALVTPKRWYRGQHEALAAIQMALAIADATGHMQLELGELCKETLNKLDTDHEFIQSWNDPKSYRDVLGHMAYRVVSALHRAKRDRAELERLFKKPPRIRRKRKK